MSNYLKTIKALYSSNYERRTKKCLHCNVEFCDITKRNLKNRCSEECSYSSMVSTRKSNGTYVQSLESKNKKSISVKLTWQTREVFSVELRKKFSETMKKSWKEGKINPSNNWSKTDEGKKKLSELAKGKLCTPEMRKNMSIAAQARLRTKREKMYTTAKGGTRNDLNQYFRSSWEANFARILNFQGKQWQYEPKTFQLTETMSHTPDFFCEGVFFEIKGRMDETSKNKLELMFQLFPDVKIEVIDCVKYNLLRLQYKQLLKSTWEGK